MKLSVVIPARNEVGSIGRTLRELGTRLRHDAIVYEIIVVDDGGTDGTADEVRRCAEADSEIRLVQNTSPHGYGRAVREGLAAVTGDAVVIVMADGSDDAGDVVKYYHVLRDVADCAFGSRFSRGATVRDYPLVKLVLNRLGNFLVRILFGLRFNDVTNAFKGYRKYVIDGCAPLVSPHFNLTVELPLKAIARGYTYAVVPVNWYGRATGRSHFDIPEMGSRYLYIILNIWLERQLTKGDYRRPAEHQFAPWTAEPPEGAAPVGPRPAIGQRGAADVVDMSVSVPNRARHAR